MSKIEVNEIVERTTGSGVHIPGHVIQTVTAASTSNGSTTSSIISFSYAM